MGSVYDLDNVCVINMQDNSLHDLGTGVNIISGQPLGSPFRPASPTRSPRADEFTSVPAAHGEGFVSICETEETARSAFYFAAGATCSLNMLPIDITTGIRAKLMSSVQQSSTSFSMVVSWKRTYTESTTQRFQLTDDTLNLAAADPQEFRKLYGDYFVHSRIRGSMFTAVMTWRCTSATEEKAIKSEASAKVEIFRQTPLSMEFYAGLDRLVAEHKLSVKCSYETVGEPTILGPNTPTAPPCDSTRPGDIFEYLAWFKNHSVGCDIALVLWRYTLLPELSTSGIRDAHAFDEGVARDLREIRECLFLCRVLSNSIPDRLVGANGPTIVGELRYNVVDLAYMCTNKQKSLPFDPALRSDLLKQLRALRLRLRELHSTYDLWAEVNNVYREETSHTRLPRIDVEKPKQHWGYGKTTLTLAVTHEFFVLHEISKTLRVDSVSAPSDGKHDVFLEISVKNLEDFVVGWAVESSQALGHSGWRRVSPSIIFSRNAVISIRPGKKLRFPFGNDEPLYSNWTLTLYVLRKVPMFTMLCEFAPPAPTSHTIVTEDTRDSSKD